MALTPDEVLQQTFKERFKGYDVSEVDAFLEKVMASLAELHAERDELALRLEQRAEEPGDAELLTRTLVTAQRAADETLAQAQEEADRMLEDARADAARTVDEAEQRIVAARDRLEAEAARVSRAAESLVRFRKEYRSRVQSVITDQLALLDQAGELPDVPPEIAALATYADSEPGSSGRELGSPESVLQAMTGPSTTPTHGRQDEGEGEAGQESEDRHVGEA